MSHSRDKRRRRGRSQSESGEYEMMECPPSPGDRYDVTPRQQHYPPAHGDDAHACLHQLLLKGIHAFVHITIIIFIAIGRRIFQEVVAPVLGKMTYSPNSHDSGGWDGTRRGWDEVDDGGFPYAGESSHKLTLQPASIMDDDPEAGVGVDDRTSCDMVSAMGGENTSQPRPQHIEDDDDPECGNSVNDSCISGATGTSGSSSGSDGHTATSSVDTGTSTELMGSGHPNISQKEPRHRKPTRRGNSRGNAAFPRTKPWTTRPDDERAASRRSSMLPRYGNNSVGGLCGTKMPTPIRGRISRHRSL